MAVYTHVPGEELARFFERYDEGSLLSAKGIAEGVENSNYLIDTSKGRYILTLYEKRVREEDLPFFMALTEHLATKGLPVPGPIHDRSGQVLQRLEGRPACLIEFLTGVSLDEPDPAACREIGQFLARMHLAVADFDGSRPNTLSLHGWRALAADCGHGLTDIAPDLGRLVATELDELSAHWPASLPQGVIHADLFPDNALFHDGEISGVIDFYFACTDSFAYDLAITHAAWTFSPDGRSYHQDRAQALIEGYRSVRPLSDAEIAVFPLLCRGAALRFLLTRCYDWLHTPADAMVNRKDPLAFRRRLDFYTTAGDSLIAQK